MSFADDLMQILTKRVPCDDPDAAHVVSLSSDGDILVTMRFGTEVHTTRLTHATMNDRQPAEVADEIIEGFIGPPRA